MARPSPIDIERAKYANSFVVKDKQDNSLATAAQPAKDGARNYILQVDASYSSSAVSGLLQVKSGTAVVAEKYIHGTGAFDFGDIGLDAENVNEAVSAELAASGTAGVFGAITLMGFYASESS